MWFIVERKDSRSTDKDILLCNISCTLPPTGLNFQMLIQRRKRWDGQRAFIHHINPLRAWEIIIRQLLLTSCTAWNEFLLLVHFIQISKYTGTLILFTRDTRSRTYPVLSSHFKESKYLVFHIRINTSRDRSVVIPTGYGMDDRDSIPGRDKNFLVSTVTRPAVRPTQLHIQ
jgi:hypothetical protein